MLFCFSFCFLFLIIILILEVLLLPLLLDVDVVLAAVLAAALVVFLVKPPKPTRPTPCRQNLRPHLRPRLLWAWPAVGNSIVRQSGVHIYSGN